MDYGGLWGGLAIFLIPAALFAWSVYSEPGRAAHERAVEEAGRLAKGLPPSPPRSALGRWARRRPWPAAAAQGLVAAMVFGGLGLWVLDDSRLGALVRALVYGAEVFFLSALFLVRDQRRARQSSAEDPG